TGSSSERRLKRAVRWLGESLSGSAMRPADFITRAANSLEQKLNAISRKKRSAIKKSLRSAPVPGAATCERRGVPRDSNHDKPPTSGSEPPTTNIQAPDKSQAAKLQSKAEALQFRMRPGSAAERRIGLDLGSSLDVGSW